MKIAPSTYYAAKSRPLSPRKLRDNQLKPIITELFAENARSVRKMWQALRRRGDPVGRDQVARLMRELRRTGAIDA